MDTLSATESYFSLLLNLPQLSAMTVLATFFLTLGRILPVVSLAPFLGLGAKSTPAPLRIMFGLALVALFLPHNLLTVHAEIPFNFSFMFYFLKELLLGFILGFLAMIPFLTAQMAGSLIDFQRGASSLQVSDPTTQTQTGPIGLLCNFMLIAIFFLLNGPFLFLNAVADSYAIIPVDQFITPSFFLLEGSFFKQATALIARMMRIAAQLAAPALIGILLTDLFLGIANRLAPQVQIVFLGIALKSWVGIALMTAAWALMLQVMSQDAINWIGTIKNLITSFSEPLRS